jgi:hypothetical protein
VVAVESIDRVSGLKATSCTPALARETVGGGNDNTYSVDLFYPKVITTSELEGGTSASATTAADNVHNCSDSPPTITLTAPSTCTNSCVITATVTQGTHPLSSSQYPGTVTFDLNGKEINKQYVSSSPSTVSFNYSPSGSGSATLSASVTDSVLYEGTDSTHLTYSAQSALSITSASASNNSVTLTWSGGGGTFNGSANGIATGCQGISGNSCTISGLQPNTAYTVDLTDSDGDSTSTQATTT